MTGSVRALVTGLVSARALTHVSTLLSDDARRPWTRTNHAGREVTLLEGPVAVTALLAGALASHDPSAAARIVIIVPGVLGGVDDLVGDTGTKGLRGHLGALRAGTVTTGALKIAGLGASAVAAALLVKGEKAQPSRLVAGAPRGSGGALRQSAVDAVLIAGTANLVNLLDLRPGRALKVTTVGGLLLLIPEGSRSLAGAIVGAAGVLPEDLAGESMLGDCGANALGGALGLALVRGLGPRGRLAAAAVVTGLTLASEKVSFTRVIESTPVLREIDAWGRAR